MAWLKACLIDDNYRQIYLSIILFVNISAA